MPKFKEQASVLISENKELVISTNEDEDLVLAQRILYKENNREIRKVFLKGAVIISNPHIDGFLKACEELRKKL